MGNDSDMGFVQEHCPVSPTPAPRPQLMGRVFDLIRSCFVEKASVLPQGHMALAASRDHYSYPLRAAVTKFHPLRPAWSLITCA